MIDGVGRNVENIENCQYQKMYMFEIKGVKVLSEAFGRFYVV